MELAKEWAGKAMALPIVDQNTSWLFHDPVYDAKSDMFDPPCKARDFEDPSGRCWHSRETLPEVFAIWADHEASSQLGLPRPRTGAVIPAGEYLDIVDRHYSINEPGLRVVRVSRVAEDRWHTHVFTCGLAPGAGDVGLVAGNMKIVLTSHGRANAFCVSPDLWKASTAARRSSGV